MQKLSHIIIVITRKMQYYNQHSIEVMAIVGRFSHPKVIVCYDVSERHTANLFRATESVSRGS